MAEMVPGTIFTVLNEGEKNRHRITRIGANKDEQFVFIRLYSCHSMILLLKI